MIELMLGQVHHFRLYAPEKLPYAIDRYSNEAKRLYSVTDSRLSQSRYLGGKDYSIADMPPSSGCAAGRTRGSRCRTIRTWSAG